LSRSGGKKILFRWIDMPTRASCLYRFLHFVLKTLLLISVCGSAACSLAASANDMKPMASTPPMGWNDWAHYQCGFTAQTIVDNAKALVATGLAAHGYNTVTIDDCWMQKDRNADGNLQADPQRFPQGMKPVADAVHALGLKFGIYEDSGYLTCGRFAGSGEPNGGGKDHFLQDAKLFASWGVDYLKLDGCNLYAPEGSTHAEVYRKAYAAESAALKQVGRPVIFSESAPAYFQGTPDWYDVLSWVREDGELWREGTDVETFNAKKPDNPRFNSVLWNYAYNLPLGRFQKPGNWNDPDFIIGGDSGMSLTETRSQMALWAMMSAPLNLSSDLNKLTPQAIAILGNTAIIAIDQDALGRMATLIRRSPEVDVLFKPLSDGDYAVAVLNRSAANVQADLHPSDLGFAANSDCRLNAEDLWTKTHPSTSGLQAGIVAHDTAIWRISPTPSCGKPTRTGAITMIAPGKNHQSIEGYSVCLTASGRVESCVGTPAETWTVTASNALESAGRCLSGADNHPAMEACAPASTQYWDYTLVGNLVDAKGGCLTASGSSGMPDSLSIEPCGHNQRNQIWSLPN
jgi:alpha-galactosidase